jgi:tetratricopeptide (TPR) repeat protein
MRRVLATVVGVVVALCAFGYVARGQSSATPAPGTAEYHRARGWVAWRSAVWKVRREGFEAAVAELERARDLEKERDFTTLYFLGFSYLRLGRLDLADPTLKDAKALAPGFVGFVLTDALRFSAETAKDEDDARQRTSMAAVGLERYLEKLEGYGKDQPFATELSFLGHFYRGRAYSRLVGKLDHAISDLVLAMKISEDAGYSPAAEVVSLLAQAHQELEQYDEAEKIVQKAITQHPSEAAHYFNLGLILAGQHKESDSKPWFLAAIARQPDFAEAHQKLAYIAFLAGDLTSMRTHLESAAVIFEVHTKAGRPPDAIARADVEAGLGAYWQAVGDRRSDEADEPGAAEAYAEAKRHLLGALAENPNCVVALNRLVQLAIPLRASKEETEEFKRRLREIEQLRGRARKSTFC